MLRITCPSCGCRDETEFVYGGDAENKMPALSAPGTEWHEFVHQRLNKVGPHDELWYHAYGCEQWLIVRRDTLTHVVSLVRNVRHSGNSP